MAAGIAAGIGHPIVAAFLFGITLFLLSFFRDPERVPEGGEETIVSPADGTVLSVAPAPEAPPGASRRLSIFMSVFNCHVNRAPVSGEVSGYEYMSGRVARLVDEGGGDAVDVLPDGAEVLVARGDKVSAGRTPVARWKV